MLFYGVPRLSPLHQIATTPAELSAMVAAMRGQRVRGFDTETNGTRYASGKRPVGYSLGYLDEAGHPHCWYVPFGHLTQDRQADPTAARQALIDSLAGVDELVGHNLKFDLLMARAWGVELPKDAALHDTMVQAYLIREDRPLQLEIVANWEKCSPWGDALELKDQVTKFLKGKAQDRRLPLHDDDKEAGIWAYLSQYGHSEVPVGLEAEYSCRDVAHTLVLDRKQRSRAQGKGESYERRRAFLYWNEMMLIRALADMEWAGQPVDGPYLQQLARDLDIDLERRGRALDQLFGVRLRWNNDNALRAFVYGHLKLPVLIKTDSGAPSIERAALLLHKEAEPRLLEIVEYRARLKVRQTYTRSLAFSIDADGMIHTSFMQCGTETGRLSSKEPNLQNIPIRHMELSKLVRFAWLMRPGFGRVFHDYSQVELRQLAWVTRSRMLLDSYRSPAYDAYCAGRIGREEYEHAREEEPDIDVHANVARGTFRAKETDLDWKIKRRAAKIINFGVPYGMGPGGLQTNPETMLPKEEAEGFYTTYHQGNPEIRAAQQALWASMRKHKPPRFVNWMGRCRHSPALVWTDEKARAAAEREAFASLIQGGAAELTKISIVRIWMAEQAGQIPGFNTSTVHDEVQRDVPVEYIAEAAKKGRQIMEDFKGLFGPTPTVCDTEVTTTTWASKEKHKA